MNNDGVVITLGSHPAMNSVLDEMASIYRGLGAEVICIPSKTTDSVFHRDVAAWTPFGLIQCSMAKPSRQWEPAAWFEYVGIEPALVVTPPAEFEGADLLWLDSSTAILAIGQRTNALGSEVVKGFLSAHGFNVFSTTLPWWHDQHLLGVANRVGGKFVCYGGALHNLNGQLPRVVADWAGYQYKSLNVVEIGGTVVAPQLPADVHCPLEDVLQLGSKLSIVRLDINSLLAHGGGIACATGFVAQQKPPA